MFVVTKEKIIEYLPLSEARILAHKQTSVIMLNNTI